ncbi:RHS repeat domain-containing protein [Flavobacterium soli]|uniref:RHS repeat domain-containing protein n=1 Tax=Flavobacterium soli TaxID=344881 RepID=UPI000404FA34|nr:RHS repeat-associated core domain-containing protein [Flavobacterium soli]
MGLSINSFHFYIFVVELFRSHLDHLATSIFLTDANGSAYQFFLNLPFGETMAEQYPDSYYKTPFKFSGKELDEHTGLHYFGARYYDSRISIWLSVDPLAEKGPNINPYVYCMENPISLIDPDGRWPGGPNGGGGCLGADPADPDRGKSRQSVLDKARLDGAVNCILGYYTAAKSVVQNPKKAAKNVLVGVFSVLNSHLNRTVADDVSAAVSNAYDNWVKRIKHSPDPEKEFATWQGEIATDIGITLITDGALRSVKLGRGFGIAEEVGETGYVGIQSVSGYVGIQSVSMTDNLVRIVAMEDDILIFSANIGTETVEGIANFSINEGILYLDKAHIQGSEAGKVGRKALWDMGEDLGRQFNVREVHVQGGVRTTGKYKGKLPSPWIIKVNY